MRFDISEKEIFAQCILEMFDRKINSENLNKISFDSRLVEEGDVFIAFSGENSDGHDYVHDCISNGASLVINEKNGDDKKIIKVESCKQTLKQLAMKYRSKIKCKVIAITGSNGKTTTKELLAHIMKSKFSLSYTKDNYNSTIGLPLSIFSMSNSDRYFIAELGTNMKGEIEYLSEIVKPDFALITNISEAHLANFDSIEGIYKEKIKIFESLDEDGVAFVNMDDPFLSSSSSYNNSKIVKFGFSNDSDSNANYDKVSKKIRINNREIDIPSSSNLLPQNILTVFIITRELGINFDDFNKMLKTFETPIGRGNIKYCNNYIIINDTYNSNFASTVLGLKQLNRYPSKNRKIAVLGDMLELGPKEKEIHNSLSTYLVDNNIELIFTYGPLMKNLFLTVKDTYPNANIYHYSDKMELSTHLKRVIKDDDVIYVKGSRSMKMEKIIKEIS